jgi:hypothetical protein
MYIVWGIFGVHGAEGPAACCMYADTDCFDTRLGCQQGFGMVVVWEDRYARLGYKRLVLKNPCVGSRDFFGHTSL